MNEALLDFLVMIFTTNHNRKSFLQLNAVANGETTLPTFAGAKAMLHVGDDLINMRFHSHDSWLLNHMRKMFVSTEANVGNTRDHTKWKIFTENSLNRSQL